jgi:hypothetical protein
MSVTAIRYFAITLFLAGCSGNPSAAHAETPERAGNATEAASAPSERRVASAGSTEGSLKGDAIVAWFRRRGAETPGALNLDDSLCDTVSAPVPSGQALSCEQHAAIEPLVRVTRRILFDVRDGRALVLVNLAAKVEPFAPSSGAGNACEGALILLHVKLSADARTLTVVDDAGCSCEQGERFLDKGGSGDGKAVELQAREVKQACSQRGAYVWDEHGYAPAQGD